MQELTTEDQVDRVFEVDRAVIFKHSTRCPISCSVEREVETFQASRPQIPIFIVDVIENRLISSYVAQKTGVPHESPQALVLDQGQIIWRGSHFSVDAKTLALVVDKI